MSSFYRIEPLNKDNYDTWRVQVEALLIKNDAFGYISGDVVKPGRTVENTEAIAEWLKNDKKAKSDIILLISPNELKQIKGCETSKEVWTKLENIYRSRGPARKATLLKQLTQHKMVDGDDIREHLDRFFDAVDKLDNMDVEINCDLLAILLLHSLPEKYENFRCAIESRDELPSPEILRVKIMEESDSRKGEQSSAAQGALWIKGPKKQPHRKQCEKPKHSEPRREFKFKCHRCRQVGHMSKNCPNKEKVETSNTCFQTSENVSEKWCLDSGATSHLCSDIKRFNDVNKKRIGKLNLANGDTIQISGIGKIEFEAENGKNVTNLTLTNVLHAPALHTNLISVSKITDKGNTVLFTRNEAIISNHEDEVVLIAKRVDDLYVVSESNEKLNDVANLIKTNNSFRKYHRIMGHLNLRSLKDALTSENIHASKVKFEDFECDVCLQGKMTRLHFPKTPERSTKLLEIIHSDVCGPMRTQSKGKMKYFVTFTDDYSGWRQVKFIHSKDQVLSKFIEFVNNVENQTGKRVKHIQSDNGTEYVNKSFDDYLTMKGIARRLTIANNPEQNGVSERTNRTLLEPARCLLMQSGLPTTFWAEAVNAACYIRNRCPSRSLNGKTPLELWCGKIPNINDLQEFGSQVYCLNRNSTRGKLDVRGRRGIFLGYPEEQKGFRIWLIEEKKLEISRDVKFVKDKNRIPWKVIDESLTGNESELIEIILEENQTRPNIPRSEETTEEREATEEEPSNPEQPVLERGPGRPKILRTGNPGRPKKVYNEIPKEEVNLANTEYCHLAEVPMKAAMSSSEATQWNEAMMNEMKSILKYNTWKLVNRPKNKLIVGSRMILREKIKPDGTIERRKARLVAQGFCQTPGVHFNETFAPVARIGTIRAVVALAAQRNMKIRQFDVSTAYLNGNLQEEIFMEAPKNAAELLQNIVEEKTNLSQQAADMLLKLKKNDCVCLLKRGLYGLKQAGRQWYEKLNTALQNIGAEPTCADPCLYLLKRGEEISAYIIIYVDDILVVSKNDETALHLLQMLKTEFEVKDLGEAKHCLGIEFTREGNQIRLNQQGFVTELLKRFNMLDCNPVMTPLDPGIKLSKGQDTLAGEVTKYPFRELVGALTYLSTSTRPDICHTVSYLGQFSHCYQKEHWLAAKRVLRYLKGTANLGLCYKPNKSDVKGFVDADWGSDKTDRKSYTGYCFLWANSPISWESKKQRSVALSTNEAEYMGMAEATKEAIFLRNLMLEIGVVQGPLLIYNDNQGALKLSENPVFHNRSKHIDMRYHFLRDKVKVGTVTFKHISTNRMIADILTKGLHGPKHQEFITLMGLQEVTSSRPEGRC